MFAIELAEKADGKVLSNTVNVGQTASGLNRRMPWWARLVYNPVAHLFFQTPTEAARAVVNLVHQADASGGHLNGKFYTCFEDHTGRISQTARYSKARVKAWAMAEEAVGWTFPL